MKQNGETAAKRTEGTRSAGTDARRINSQAEGNPAKSGFTAGTTAAAAADSISQYLQAKSGGFTADIQAAGKPIETGFTCIDAAAGGLYSGLYTVAAAPGVGKTTFCLQLADQLAAAGHDVIFFSLEQGRAELCAKSVTRYAAQLRETAPGGSSAAEITANAFYSPQGAETAATINAAIKAYTESIKDRLTIVEGNFSCDVDYIRGYVGGYVERTARRPVVIVDYLQILQPASGSGSGKEAVDDIATALKRTSREYNIPVIAISSVNRAGYLTPIEFESLKESGAIEFSSDVVWGLQLAILADAETMRRKTEDARREILRKELEKSPRQLQFVCLKNRRGVTGYTGRLEYYPAQERFTEQPAPARKRGAEGDPAAVPII